MKNRKERIDLMVDLIRNHCISSQEELASRLAEQGYNVTQATLSRDLKMLKTTKVPTDRDTFFQSGFISLRISGNIAVIKTRNGYAAGLAYDIDMSKAPEILGTIPGSDTIFAVLDENLTHEEAMEVFGRLLPLDQKHHYR